MCQLSDVAMLDIGAWADAKDKSRMAMPFRYSEAKMTMQASQKAYVIDITQKTIAKYNIASCKEPEQFVASPYWVKFEPPRT